MAIRPYDAREAYRKSLLKQMGLSQQELGAILGRSQPFVSQFLSGKIRSPQCEVLFARLVQQPREVLFSPEDADDPDIPSALAS